MKASNTAWAALPLVLALAGCGGGSGSNNSTPSTPETPVVPSADRIEPFDPSGTAKAQAAPAAPVHAAAGPQATRTVALGALAQPKAAAAAEPGVPLQIGTARGVQDTATVAATASLLRWQPTAHGTQVAALRFTAEGAHGVRLGVLVQALPAGAVLRFYGATDEGAVEIGADELRAVAERNAQGGAADDAARTYWSPDFGGPQTTLEVEIPAGAQAAAVQLAVPRLSHFTVAPAAAEEAAFAKVGESGSCNVDVTCRPEYIDQSRSVARMIYVREDGKSYLCTGTLLNDAQSSGTPYFLSANHCISTQAVASTLTTDWFYRSASCGGSGVNPAATRLAGGATLLYASATTDVSFLRLDRPAPAGIVYAGTYFGGVQAGQVLAGVHHPKGDLQKVSHGVVLRYSTCSGEWCTNSDDTNGTFLTLGWQQGVVEGGSSGSGAFITIGPRRYVVGQLFGGTSSCENPAGVDHYGRFDTSYRAAIKNWLNP